MMFPRCGTLFTYGSALVTSTFRFPFTGALGGPVTSRYGDTGSVRTTGLVAASAFTGPLDSPFAAALELFEFAGAGLEGFEAAGLPAAVGLSAGVWGLAVLGLADAAAMDAEMALREWSARVWGFWSPRMVLMAGATCLEATRVLEKE